MRAFIKVLVLFVSKAKNWGNQLNHTALICAPAACKQFFKRSRWRIGLQRARLTVLSMSSKSVQARSQVAIYVFLLWSVAVFSGCRTSPEAKEAKFLKRGQALVAQKEYARAVLEFRNAATAKPQDAEPHYQMGMAYLASGDMRGAIGEFQRATSLNPKHAGAQLKLSEFMTLSRNENLLREAITRLQTVFGDSPDNPEAMNTLALAEWNLGKSGDAIQRLDDILQKFPTNLQSSMILARMKLSKNDWDGAEVVLKKAVADAPQSASAALALGEFYSFTKQPAKAETEVKRALQLDPKNGGALVGLASILITVKRLDEAEQVIRQLSALPEKSYKPLHAVFLYQTGKRDAALAEFETLAKADPNDREARTRLVAAYFGTNRVSDAEKVLDAALKRNAKDTDALLQRAEMRLKSGKVDDAEKDLKDVIRFAPESAGAHFMLSKVYRAKGLPNNQQEELQQTLRLNPEILQARLELELSFLAANQAKAAISVIDDAPEAQKKQLPWMIGRNWALMAGGNLQEAKTGIEGALKEGRPAEAVYQNAVLHFLQRDYPGTLVALEELMKSGTVDLRVAKLTMGAYAARQEIPKGIAKLKEMVAANPGSPQLKQLLGQWYAQIGNGAEAKKAYEAAVAVDRQFVPATLSLAEIEIKEGRYEAARQKLGAVVSGDTANVSALLLLAQAEEAAGDRASMIKRYRTVLGIDNSNVLALNNLAYSLAPDNPDEALKFAQQAAEKAPDSPYVQDTLGWVYYRKGLYSMAVRCLKTAVDKEPTPRRQFHLGMSYLKSGDQATGQKFVKEALLKDPNLVKTEQGW